MRFKNETIPLSDIDSNDETYRITTETDVSEIAASIASIGLVNTPIFFKDSSRVIVVSGFRRIKACEALGLKEIEARVIGSDSSHFERVEIAVCENSLQRSLNLVEISRALNLLFQCCRDVQTVAEKAAVLGLPANISVINKIKDLCHCPGPVQDAVICGAISLPIAQELGKMEQETSIILSNILRDLKVGLNKQREIITMIKEIAERENLSLKEVLNHPEWRNIVNSNHMDITQKRMKIRKYLKQRRFPTLTRAETMFETYRKKLNLGTHTNLIPPPYFEGNTFTFSIYFKNVAELERQLEKLTKITKDPNLLKIVGKYEVPEIKTNSNSHP
ncbi:MAG: ParB N-terminal domain-containing protein [Deltaproteobacteria bacterium]|nr:ParB N-terminal domain-containing protein [Deltaproteobacteria bacterium]